jgi:hypothetical protein
VLPQLCGSRAASTLPLFSGMTLRRPSTTALRGQAWQIRTHMPRLAYILPDNRTR